LGFRIAETVRAEMAFNASGADRKIENHQKDGGKKVTQPSKKKYAPGLPSIQISQANPSAISPCLRFHLAAARSMLGAGGPIVPQSGHRTVNVPLATI
jgi:hypothetical protein